MIEGHPGKLVPTLVSPTFTGKAATPNSKPFDTPERPSFKQVLASFGSEVRRGESLVERAVHARADLSAGELIALQAGVYRWVEVVDLASKLVDRATQAAKTVTQGSGG